MDTRRESLLEPEQIIAFAYGPPEMQDLVATVLRPIPREAKHCLCRSVWKIRCPGTTEMTFNKSSQLGQQHCSCNFVLILGHAEIQMIAKYLPQFEEVVPRKLPVLDSTNALHSFLVD